VDAVDRRLVQLETLDRRTGDSADVIGRLSGFGDLSQRVSELEKTVVLAAGQDRAGTQSSFLTCLFHAASFCIIIPLWYRSI